MIPTQGTPTVMLGVVLRSHKCIPDALRAMSRGHHRSDPTLVVTGCCNSNLLLGLPHPGSEAISVRNLHGDEVSMPLPL